MNIVLIWLWLSKNGSFSELLVIPKKCTVFTEGAAHAAPPSTVFCQQT